MEMERAKERRVRVVIKSGGVVLSRSSRLYVIKDDPVKTPAEEEKKSKELVRKRPRLDIKKTESLETTAMKDLRRKRVVPIKCPLETNEAQSSTSDDEIAAVQVPQNLLFGDKFEITKQNLQVNYQETKKQRCIKFLEMDELPKQQDKEEKLRAKKRANMPSYRLRW